MSTCPDALSFDAGSLYATRAALRTSCLGLLPNPLGISNLNCSQKSARP